MKNEKPKADGNSRSDERPKDRVSAKSRTSDETTYVEFVTSLDRISDQDIENALVEHTYAASRSQL